MIIDANDMIVGRIATIAAKSALMGQKVDIVNCEMAVMTGNKDDILARYKAKRVRGTHSTGPFIHRNPDRFVRRIIRGMLPYKQERGKTAFMKIMCHIGVPADLEKETKTKIDSAHISKLPTEKYVYVKDICKFMGAKI